MEMFEAGMIFYQLDVVLNIWLLAVLWKGDRRPYFFAFTAFRLIVTLVRFPALLAGGMDMYSRVYWLTSCILVFASVWVLCDFFPKMMIPISLVAVTLSFRQLLYPTLALERNAEIAMFVAAFYVLLRDRKNMVAAGLVIGTLFSVITEMQSMDLAGNLMRFLPSVSYLIAQLIWIFGARKARDTKVLSHRYLQPRTH
jgi:hypothetical protein